MEVFLRFFRGVDIKPSGVLSAGPNFLLRSAVFLFYMLIFRRLQYHEEKVAGKCASKFISLRITNPQTGASRFARIPRVVTPTLALLRFMTLIISKVQLRSLALCVSGRLNVLNKQSNFVLYDFFRPIQVPAGSRTSSLKRRASRMCKEPKFSFAFI